MLKLNAPLIAAALVFAAAARADDAKATYEQYHGCDGYGQALEDSDGITVHWTVWGMEANAGVAPRSTLTHTGMSGIEDCNAALADLNAKHWLRKASLLRARAMHHLEIKEYAAAIADLDLAQQAGASGDIYYRRSLGAGIDFLRAYAFRLSGDQARGEALAVQTMEAHPFSRQMMGAAILASGYGISDADDDKAHKYLARLMPTAIDDIYLDALSQYRFADAITLYDQIVPPHEIGRVNITSGAQRERDLRDFETAEIYWATHSGSRAFALAALGRTDEAKAVMQAERDRIAVNAAPPPPTPPELSPPEHAKAEALRDEVVKVHERAQKGCTKIIDVWQPLVDARILVAQGKTAEALKQIEAHPLPGGWPSIEIMEAIDKQLPKTKKPAVSLAQTFKDAQEKKRAARQDTTPGLLYRSLPDVETAERVPPYVQVSKSFFNNDPNGVRVTTLGDVTSVAVRGDKGTGAMIEEMTLPKCADLARAAGKKGFVIVARADTSFEIDTTYYGRTVSTAPNGYETSLDVVFVDPAALPDKFKSASWRVIDADAVYAALAPVYITGKTR